MKEQFKTMNLRNDSLKLIDISNTIIDQYLAQGLRLTLRQLYYQLVVRNVLPNTEKSYRKLSSTISDGRLCGMVDWDAIEDRLRRPSIPQEFTGLDELVDTALNAYRLDRWDGQTDYVELWVEKDALAGVLRPLGYEFHVTIMVNRGYSSQSAMYESANRFRDKQDRNCHLFYLGDHDPSGEDMVRDIRDRFTMYGVDVDVHKIALNMDQVRTFNPPPNPAKITDPRAGAYIAKFGRQSWEVDALPPDELQRLIRGAISEVVDVDELDRVKEQERSDKKRLRTALKSLEAE